jgi:RNA polymerase sigma-70 factor (ECF subfamily)
MAGRMDEPRDRRLVRKAAAGDAKALESLVERHYDAVFRLAYRWCGRRQDAEDIAQEVFVKLVRKLDQFQRQASFRTWLYRIVVNTAKDLHRTSSRRQRLESTFARQEASENPGRRPDEVLAARELVQALNLLPERQKAAVLLVLGEGFTHKEAAGVLGCSETTISWRVFQARRKIRKLWEAAA